VLLYSLALLKMADSKSKKLRQKCCQKSVKKLSKSAQKNVKKLSESCQKNVKECSKSCQKVVKKLYKFKTSGEDDDEEEEDWWLQDQVATSSHLVLTVAQAMVSHILRPGNTAFKEQLKLVNGFVAVQLFPVTANERLNAISIVCQKLDWFIDWFVKA
jgi:gas vesicle protein